MANTAVFGVYPTLDAAESAVRTLRDRGFRATDVSVLIPQNPGTKDLAHVRATKAPEGATAGASSGAVVGSGAREPPRPATRPTILGLPSFCPPISGCPTNGGPKAGHPT